MSIKAKDIQLFLWTIIRFSGNYFYKFVRRFPDVSGFLIFVLFLYIFFPYFFFYFMYYCPVIVCSAIYIRFYLKTKIPESQRIKEKDSGERLSADGELVNTSNKPSLRPQKSVRRNARKEVLEWDGKHSEENDVLFVRSMYEEGSKLIFDRVGSSKVEHGDGSPHDETGIDRALEVPNTVFDNETSRPHRVSDDSFRGLLGTGPGDGKLPVKSSEEAGGAGKKATQDGQKNHMDLGLTELERNKWLQSLIAKRRTKKLFRIAILKSLMGIHNDKLGHHRLNSSGTENDIVFAELEEPNYIEVINLSEEKKEKIIESLNNRTEIGEKMENPHDLEPGLDSGSEVRMETDSIKNNDSCYSSSSENTEPVLDQTIKSTRIRNDHVRRALKHAIPPKGRAMNRLSFDSSLSPSERCRTEFNSFYSRRQCHTPTFSIASDLQVEVSEVGSPPLTTDGTVSSVDGDSEIYNGDVDRDINSKSEEVWGGSVNLSREEVNRERLRELVDISEEESVAAASVSPSEHESKQNLNSKSSLSSRIDITENGASHPTYISSEAHQGSSNCRHGNLETLYEVKSTIESGKEVKESQPSKYIEEDSRTLTEHNTRDAPNAVQSRDNLKSVPDTKVGQYAAENNILEKRLRDSIARALNRRLMLEQVSVSSSPSPRSVLPQNILAGPIPISGVGRRMQRSLSHFVRKDVVRSNLAYGQAREKLTANMCHIAHEWVENSINQLTRNLSFGTFEMAPRKVIGEGNIVVNINNSERKKFESVFLIRQEDISESGKSNEEEADMKEIETIESNYTRIVESAKGETANEDESLILIRPGDISGPEKSNQQEVDMNNTETIESDYTSIVESAKEREISAAEVDRICKSNESVADNVTKKEIKNDVLEREGALQILGKLETVIEPSNTPGGTSAVSVEDAENEPKRLANAGQSTSAGETNNLNNINSGQEMQNITRQEGIKDASKSGEGNNMKAIDSIPDVDNIKSNRI